MRPLDPPAEPPGFDERVRRPGNDWLASHPHAKPSKFPDYWNEMQEEVQAAFDDCCAYLGFPVTSGEVDHFVAKKANRALTYEWSNYRWAEPRVNRLKSSHSFLDPFLVRPGWVTIDPVTLLYGGGKLLPDPMKDLAAETFRVLNDPVLVRGRRRVLRAFTLPEGGWDSARLRDFFPLMAEAVDRFTAGTQVTPTPRVR